MSRASAAGTAGYSIGCGGGGLTTVLLAVFLTLKLTGNIDWSWWWVLGPLWIPAALVAAAAVVVGVGAAIFFGARLVFGRRRRRPRLR